MSRLSRRHFLRGLGVTTGAAVGWRLGGRGLLSTSHAAGEPAAVVFLHLSGGYNALFCSADGLVGRFGVTAGNHTVLPGSVGIDNIFNQALPAFAKSHIATIGMRHGQTGHAAARRLVWASGNANAGLTLANAMGAGGPIKAAIVGNPRGTDQPGGTVNGISFQGINDMQATIDALGGGSADPRRPAREIALPALEGARTMSRNVIDASPTALESLENGYATAIDTLRAPVQSFDLQSLRTAYGLGNGSAVTRELASKFAAAELMVRAGAKVVAMYDPNWDTHGDPSGTRARNKMSDYAIAPIATFVSRMVADPTRNVTFVLMGEFSRSLPNSDHQPQLSATVIGRNVKNGSTGRVDNTMRLPPNTPGVAQFWAYLAAVAKVSNNPFGQNPHELVL